MQFLWKYIDDLIGKGLSLSTLSELMLYAAASFVPLSLPLAILLASLMTFGNLGENFELLALKSAGISLSRIMFPIVILTIIISISAFFFSNNVLPIANLKMRSLIYDIQQERPELQLKEGVFNNGIQNYSIKIGKRDKKTGLLSKLIIYDHTSNRGNVSVTIADSGYMRITPDKKWMVITLFKGYNFSEELPSEKKHHKTDTYPFRRNKFVKEEFNIELVGFGLSHTDENLFKSDFQMMNIKQLKLTSDSFQRTIDSSRVLLVRNLNTSSFYKKSFKPFNKDTVKAVINKSYNTDSIYKMIPQNEKMNAIGFALNSARNLKNYISSENSIYDSNYKRLRKCDIEWHRKFTLSVCCFIFFFIGAPLGAIIRKGGLGMPLVISVIFFVIYYVISITGEKFVRENMVSVMQGMWISSFILLPIGIFLTYKASNDSAILNMDFYVAFLKKIPIINLLLKKNKPE